MTREQDAIVRRLRRLIRDAKAAGIALVADASGSGSIRAMTAEEAARDDIRDLGESVPLHGGCGAPVMSRIDPYGNG